MNFSYYVYIVECKDKTLYIGITTDINRRIKEHNSSGKGAKYTRSRRPVKLAFFEKVKNRSCATKREYEIKKRYTRKKKLILIGNFNSMCNK